MFMALLVQDFLQISFPDYETLFLIYMRFR